MVTKELLEYIKSQKAKQISDENLVNNLSNNNWEVKDIEEALEKVGKIEADTPFEVEIKDRDKVFVIDDTVSHPATQATENLAMPIGDKPKVFASIVSILLAVISFLLIYKAGIMVAVMSVVDYYSHTTGAMYYFLSEFPLYGWVIMAFSLSACVFLYGAFKAGSGSRSFFRFGIFSLLFLPISLSYINYKLMYSVAKYFSSEKLVFKNSAPSIPTETSTLLVGVLGEPAFIVSLVALALLLFSHKRFRLPKKTLSGQARKILLMFILLFTIPTAFMVYSGYSKAKNDDFGYMNAQYRVGYKILRPSPMPLGLVYATNFISNKELAGRGNAVQVTYGFTYEKSPDISESRPIVVKQVAINDNFLISSFLSTEMGIYSSQKTVDLKIAKNGMGYLIEKRSGEGKISKNLILLTSDDVLISISTIDSSEYDLIDIANALR